MAEMRKCIGSARFGIEPHLAPVEDFPAQPSQRDGLGRMCRTHWNAYTKALAAAASNRKTAAEAEATKEPGITAAVTDPAEIQAAPSEWAPKRSRRPKTPAPVDKGEEAAG